MSIDTTEPNEQRDAYNPVTSTYPQPVDDLLRRLAIVQRVIHPDGETYIPQSAKSHLSEEKRSILLQEVNKLAELFIAAGVKGYLGGSVGLALAINGDVHRDKNDLDVDMEKKDIDTLFLHARRNGYICFDPVKKKPLFLSNKIDKRVIFGKSDDTKPGPKGFDVFVMEDNGERMFNRTLEFSFPAQLYENAPVYITEQGNSIDLVPPAITMFYKLAYASTRQKPQDIEDIRFLYPKMTGEMHKDFYLVSQESFPLFMRNISSNPALVSAI